MKNFKPRISRMSADDPEKLVHRELSRSIVGAAMQVLNTLKPGLNEKAYENAMVIELQKRGHKTEQQRRFDVFYQGIWVDTLVPDLIVDGLVIVDPKVVTDFNETHQAQMIGYLAITSLQLAMLLNFKHADLRWKRVVRQVSHSGETDQFDAVL
ncbi:MAG: GxxExxY protein [Prosthecobacter sp.]